LSYRALLIRKCCNTRVNEVEFDLDGLAMMPLDIGLAETSSKGPNSLACS
jgi:hypothetical protein